MKTFVICCALLGALTSQELTADAAEAQAAQQRDTDGAYYSPRLKAQFRIEQFFLPQFGWFHGARLVSEPDFDSPLNAIGLRAGDVITRLDGIRVDNLAELDNHYAWTSVRYIKTGTQVPFNGRVFIPVWPGPVVQPNGGVPVNVP